MHFTKYQALGNDYLVMSAAEQSQPTNEQTRKICNRNYGIGSDGILVDTGPTGEAQFSLVILNPDGSEAEKSGNGLRIFARYLWDLKRVTGEPFSIATRGGIVSAQVAADGGSVRVEMGTVTFSSSLIPVVGSIREVLRERLDLSDELGSQMFEFCAASVGNPHCVILCEQPVSAQFAQRWGSVIEIDPQFPNRTNVQFMHVIDRQSIEIQIWERGAGYTLASGSSSTAAAGVARRLGLCGDRIEVSMPGGKLDIAFDEHFGATMTGPVSRVCDATISPEALTADISRLS